MTASERADDIGAAINAYHDTRRFEINGDRHAVEMLIADLIQFCESEAISFDRVLTDARNLAAEI